MHMKYIFINILKLFYLFKKLSISPTLLTSTGSQRTGLRDIRISSFSLSLLCLWSQDALSRPVERTR